MLASYEQPSQKPSVTLASLRARFSIAKLRKPSKEDVAPTFTSSNPRSPTSERVRSQVELDRQAYRKLRRDFPVHGSSSASATATLSPPPRTTSLSNSGLSLTSSPSTPLKSYIKPRPKYIRRSSFSTLVGGEDSKCLKPEVTNPGPTSPPFLGSRWSLSSSDEDSETEYADSSDDESDDDSDRNSAAAPPHDRRWASGWSDSPTVCDQIRPESPLAGLFENYVNSSVESLIEPSDYFPTYSPPRDDDSEDEEDDIAIVHVQPSHTPAPFPIYNVFICAAPIEPRVGTLVRRRSASV